MIELTIPTLLQASTAVTAITGTRIYPLVLPDEVVLPAIHYSLVGSSASPTFDTSGTMRFRVEVNAWGNTYAEAVTLRQAVIAALNRYSDTHTSIQFLMSQDLFEHDLLQYRCVTEFYLYATHF